MNKIRDSWNSPLRKWNSTSSSAIRLTFRPRKSPRSNRKCAISIRAARWTAAPDGLDFYRKLAAEAKPFLKPDGKIMLEFGDGQADAIRTIFEAEKWIVEAVKEDYSQRERILIAKSSSSSSS